MKYSGSRRISCLHKFFAPLNPFIFVAQNRVNQDKNRLVPQTMGEETDAGREGRGPDEKGAGPEGGRTRRGPDEKGAGPDLVYRRQVSPAKLQARGNGVCVFSATNHELNRGF